MSTDLKRRSYLLGLLGAVYAAIAGCAEPKADDPDPDPDPDPDDDPEPAGFGYDFGASFGY